MTRAIFPCLFLLATLVACGSGSDSGGGNGPYTCCSASAGDPTTASCIAGAGGAAQFSEVLIENGFVHGQEMELVDMNGDGAQDLLVAYSLTDAIHLYVNNCNSWDLVQITPRDTLVATGVASGDFDNDGDIDVVAAEVFGRNSGGGSLRWYENPGTLSDGWTERNISGDTLDGPRTVQVADMSGDGQPDLIVGTANYGPGIQWFENTGGAFTGPLAVDAELDNVHNFVIHDVDGDGSLDVVSAAVDDAEIAWYESDRAAQPSGTIVFTKHLIEAVAAPYGVAMGNLDDDEALELVANNARGVEVYDPPADPTGSWTSTAITSTFAGDANVYLVVADFNGDASDDVAAVSGDSAAARVYTRSGASFTESAMADGYAGLNGILAGDVDGDGDVDLLTSTYENGSTDRISWWNNSP